MILILGAWGIIVTVVSECTYYELGTSGHIMLGSNMHYSLKVIAYDICKQ